MTAIHTLASGSSGNAALVSWSGGQALLDAGISCRRVEQSLRTLGTALGDLDGIFITHTHSDHISGLQTLLKRTACPLFASAPAAEALAKRFPGAESRLREVSFCRGISLADCRITAFPTSHDAPGSCGWRFDTEEGSLGLLTDTGAVTPEAAVVLPGVDVAVLEANHDVETLKSGPYPYYLKRRILGPWGHLSNGDAAAFAVTLAEAGASEIILAHLSRENNTPAMARRAVETALSGAGLAPLLSVAPRDCPGQAHEVGRALCRESV